MPSHVYDSSDNKNEIIISYEPDLGREETFQTSSKEEGYILSLDIEHLF